MPLQSEKPFGDALRALMGEQDLTFRSLAEATRQLDGKGLTHAYINMLANGHDKPSMRAMVEWIPFRGQSRALVARRCSWS
jgi:hypothetical protein